MNALDFVTQAEFNYVKYKFDKRENFELGKKYKSSKGYIEIKIKSGTLDRQTQADLIDDIWCGENYLVYINENHNICGDSIGGCGYGEKYSDFKKYFENFDMFIDMINRLLKKFPEYEEIQVQLSLF